MAAVSCVLFWFVAETLLLHGSAVDWSHSFCLFWVLDACSSWSIMLPWCWSDPNWLDCLLHMCVLGEVYNKCVPRSTCVCFTLILWQRLDHWVKASLMVSFSSHPVCGAFQAVQLLLMHGLISAGQWVLCLFICPYLSKWWLGVVRTEPSWTLAWWGTFLFQPFSDFWYSSAGHVITLHRFGLGWCDQWDCCHLWTLCHYFTPCVCASNVCVPGSVSFLCLE